VQIYCRVPIKAASTVVAKRLAGVYNVYSSSPTSPTFCRLHPYRIPFIYYVVPFRSTCCSVSPGRNLAGRKQAQACLSISAPECCSCSCQVCCDNCCTPLLGDAQAAAWLISFLRRMCPRVMLWRYAVAVQAI